VAFAGLFGALAGHLRERCGGVVEGAGACPPQHEGARRLVDCLVAEASDLDALVEMLGRSEAVSPALRAELAAQAARVVGEAKRAADFCARPRALESLAVLLRTSAEDEAVFFAAAAATCLARHPEAEPLFVSHGGLAILLQQLRAEALGDNARLELSTAMAEAARFAARLPEHAAGALEAGAQDLAPQARAWGPRVHANVLALLGGLRRSTAAGACPGVYR